MSARSNSLKPDTFYDAPIETIREMVKRAEAKLHALNSRRADIRRRIQALHHLSITFAVDPVYAASRDLEAAAKPVKERADAVVDKKSFSVTGRQAEMSALRRACRIALMETQSAACAEQILQRINRRQSVSFKSDEDRIRLVTEALQRMAKDDEVIVSISAGVEQWGLSRAVDLQALLSTDDRL
jgi:DNA repair exonuclease SbcCD ATPase subunit